MQDDNAKLEELSMRLRGELSAVATEVSRSEQWGLSTPVAVIDARSEPAGVSSCPVGGITTALPASRAIDDPMIRKMLLRCQSEEPETVLHQLLSGPEAEAFAEAYEAYIGEKEAMPRAVWGLDDSAAFVAKAREAFSDGELAIVALMPGHEVLTYCLPLSWLRA